MARGDVVSPLPGETRSHNWRGESYVSVFHSRVCSLTKTLLSVGLWAGHNVGTRIRLWYCLCTRGSHHLWRE